MNTKCRCRGCEFCSHSGCSRPAGPDLKCYECAALGVTALTDQRTFEDARRLVLPSLARLSEHELVGLAKLHLKVRDREAGTMHQRMADYHNDLLALLLDERERRTGTLQWMSREMDETEPVDASWTQTLDREGGS